MRNSICGCISFMKTYTHTTHILLFTILPSSFSVVSCDKKKNALQNFFSHSPVVEKKATRSCAFSDPIPSSLKLCVFFVCVCECVFVWNFEILCVYVCKDVSQFSRHWFNSLTDFFYMGAQCFCITVNINCCFYSIQNFSSSFF